LRSEKGNVPSEAIIGEVVSIVGKDITVEAKINNEITETN
jgi:hypothetical protein